MAAKKVLKSAIVTKSFNCKEIVKRKRTREVVLHLASRLGFKSLINCMSRYSIYALF